MNIASPTYHQTIGLLNDTVEFFLKTGFIVLSAPKVDLTADYSTRRRQYDHGHKATLNPVLRKVVRTVARELKRPAIVAETKYWRTSDGVIEVKLKKMKRHAPLMSTFFLLDTFQGSHWQMSDPAADKSTFRWRNTPTNWELVFIGAKGREQFDDWMNFIQTNPECRKALKLPELPDNVIPLAA